MKRLSESAVEAQIKAKRGNLAAVGRAFGVTRAAVHDYIRKRPALREVLRAAREEMLDVAEWALTDAVLDRHPWAVMFLLRTQGRGRGYGRATAQPLN
jgi:predicted transcriptional regulator